MKNNQKISIVFGTLAAVVALLVFSNNVSAQEGVRHKSVYNQTQGRDATTATANGGDIVEYTLTFDNTSTQNQIVAIVDDVGSVLQWADITNYNGAQLSGSTLTFPSVTLSPGARSQRTFVVRVKEIPYAVMWMTMTNTYGDTVSVNVAARGSGGSATQSLSAYNVTQNRGVTSVSARPGDIIEYTLTTRNNSGSAQTITISDYIGDVLAYAEINSITNNGNLSGSTVSFPSFTLNSGEQITRTFRVRVRDLTTYSGDLVMSNTFGNQVNISVTPGSSSYSGDAAGRSKSAYNQTQGRDAQTVYAVPGDFITYTLSYVNNTGVSQNIAIEDDMADVLYLSDLTNRGEASLSGNILRFPQVSVPAGSRIDRSFQVRVRDIPAGTIDNVMSNFYGNGVDIRVSTTGGYTPVVYPPVVKGAYVSPATGPADNLAYLLAGLLTGGLLLYNKIKQRRTA